MKILITGALGNVGYELVKKFSRNNKVLAIYRNKTNILIKNKNITWQKLDLSKKIKIEYEPEIIIHCAVAHSYSKKNTENDFIDSNIKTTTNLINFIRIKPKKFRLFINFSTVSVYEEDTKIKKIDENSLLSSSSLLGITKYVSEFILVKSNINYINLRLPGIIANEKEENRPWIKTIIRDIRNHKEIKVSNINKKFNSIIDTQEIYQVIKKIISKKIINETINLTASNPIKIIEIINIIKKKLKSKSSVIKIRSLRNSLIYDDDKISKLLGKKLPSVKKIILRNIN